MLKTFIVLTLLLVSSASFADDEGCFEYSERHKVYLEYKSRFQTAWQNYLAARQTRFRDAALNAVANIEQEWEQIGYRNEIDAVSATEAVESCSQAFTQTLQRPY